MEIFLSIVITRKYQLKVTLVFTSSKLITFNFFVSFLKPFFSFFLHTRNTKFIYSTFTWCCTIHPRIETKIKQKNIHKIEYGISYKVMRVEIGIRKKMNVPSFKVIFGSLVHGTRGRSVNFYKFWIRFQPSRKEKPNIFHFAQKFCVMSSLIMENGLKKVTNRIFTSANHTFTFTHTPSLTWL